VNSQSSTTLSRRDLLRLAATGTAAAACGLRTTFGAEEKPEKIPVGLQLYSVRGNCAKNLEKTIEEVAKIGYKGVEFAGYHKYAKNPKGLRKLLDDNGLVCCGTHTSIGTLLGGNLKKTIAFHQILGNKFLIVPGLPGQYRKDKQAWLDTAKVFSDIAAKAKDDGMIVGYHNHGVEFKAIDGELPWDIFFTAAAPDVAMQIDTGNCLGSGGDPVAMLEKYAARAKTVHLKECGQPRGGVTGDGKVDWKGVFAICEKAGATDWYIVEQGGGEPIDVVRRCFQALQKMGKV